MASSAEADGDMDANQPADDEIAAWFGGDVAGDADDDSEPEQGEPADLCGEFDEGRHPKLGYVHAGETLCVEPGEAISYMMQARSMWARFVPPLARRLVRCCPCGVVVAGYNPASVGRPGAFHAKAPPMPTDFSESDQLLLPLIGLWPIMVMIGRIPES